jgi:hypothetical protein
VDRRLPSACAVIRVDIHMTQSSCGFGVPIMQFIEERETLNKWGASKSRKVPLRLLAHRADFQSQDKLDDYQDKNNRYSLDGLPGLISSRRRAGYSVRMDGVKKWGRSVWNGKLDAVLLGWLIGVFIAILNEIFSRLSR